MNARLEGRRRPSELYELHSHAKPNTTYPDSIIHQEAGIPDFDTQGKDSIMPQRVSSEDAPLLSQRLPPIGDNGHVLLTKYQPRRNERLIAYLCFLVLGVSVHCA